jgi:hypothetical protein
MGQPIEDLPVVEGLNKYCARKYDKLNNKE